MTRFIAGIAAIATVLFTNTASLQAEEVLLEGYRSKVTVHSSFRLKGDAKKKFSSFKKHADFYAAMFVNLEEDLVGSIAETTSLELAVYYARKSCRLKSQRPSQCKLHATITPKKPAADDGTTLSQHGNIAFRKYQQRQVKGKYGAFAMTENGDTGHVWNRDTEIEATAGALKFCRQGVSNTARDNTAFFVQNVIEQKRDNCRVIHITQP
ncbi:hypothetical protein [Leisingera sp. MMG026]|uniref:hypothetical protein n=1 Tax=Leisingera sp. MMG026 TaxID=2909982 RepID=UPI001F46166E|nr:hypothetical protein [Leisingera sp. MMG026]MCF6430830.1 hypothetical protein [Leisingera sp. MMG026]